MAMEQRAWKMSGSGDKQHVFLACARFTRIRGTDQTVAHPVALNPITSGQSGKGISASEVKRKKVP